MAKRTVMVALDGSKLSETVLERVRSIVGRDGDETLLVHVTEPGVELAQAGEKYLEHVQGVLAKQGVASTRLLRTGDPAESILAATVEYTPDLLAMSTHGRSGVARWARGSVAERVLRHSRVPVFMANPTAANEGRVEEDGSAKVERIVVALDGSDRAATILPLVGDLADRTDAEIVLAHVVPESDELARPAARAEAGRWLAALQAKVADCGRGVRLRIESGDDPAAAMLEIAKTEWAGLLALTTHGRTGAQRWLYGSVTEQILRQVDCPVLAVRTPWDD